MSLKDEFGIPPNTWQAMVKKGVISCAVAKQEEIITKLKGKLENHIPHGEAVQQIAIEMNCSVEWVYRVIKRYN